ncbi:hypothetical protein JOB18_035609 [Solea senegalensis]|uniref:Uncharacterized protein n=1 Tax=Solea senegalensis TaxID=28829 RepID=A0AAV6T0T1_SOLSE|nr:hypothetical protein JOB18_035609 [Solea senegalensis]
MLMRMQPDTFNSTLVTCETLQMDVSSCPHSGRSAVWTANGAVSVTSEDEFSYSEFSSRLNATVQRHRSDTASVAPRTGLTQRSAAFTVSPCAQQAFYCSSTQAEEQ